MWLRYEIEKTWVWFVVKKTKYISYVVIWYMITFQLPVNTSPGRTTTQALSLCCVQIEKIHFKAVTLTFPSLQISCTLLLAGLHGERALFSYFAKFLFSGSAKFIRGELSSQTEEINGKRLDKLAPFLKRFMFLSL